MGCGFAQGAQDHGLELVASVATSGEAGEIAFGMVGAGLSAGFGERRADERRPSGHLAPGARAGRTMVQLGQGWP